MSIWLFFVSIQFSVHRENAAMPYAPGASERNTVSLRLNVLRFPGMLCRLSGADQTRQAGPGDFVYLIGSKEASTIFRKKYIPVDASIVGFIDDYHEEL